MKSSSEIKYIKLSPAIAPKFMNICGYSVQQKYAVIGVLFIVFDLAILYHSAGHNLICNEDNESVRLRKVINPPTEKISLSLSSYENDKQLLAKKVSNIVQSQIQSIQSPSNCNEPNFLCGHYDDCGFGCQVQHRVACLMMSYAMNLPLIHNENDGWPFTQKWSEFFEPLGSNCTPGVNTFHWDWNGGGVLYRGKPCFFRSATTDQIEYPLGKGIPVSQELGDLVDSFHPNSFLWWVGQFMKYALRPRKHIAERIEQEKIKIGFANPIVGFHVRRTDKVRIAPEAFHKIEEYIQIAEDFFTNATLSQQYSGARRVFVASDDSTVLFEAQQKLFKDDWSIIGFPSVKTLRKPKERVDALFEIVRDITVLADCDYVVCGFESNICRILWPLMNGKYLDGGERLTSLDSEYFYVIQGHSIRPPIVFKVDPSHVSESIDVFNLKSI